MFFQIPEGSIFLMYEWKNLETVWPDSISKGGMARLSIQVYRIFLLICWGESTVYKTYSSWDFFSWILHGEIQIWVKRLTNNPSRIVTLHSGRLHATLPNISKYFCQSQYRSSVFWSWIYPNVEKSIVSLITYVLLRFSYNFLPLLHICSES